jgi:hypothetical protein
MRYGLGFLLVFVLLAGCAVAAPTLYVSVLTEDETARVWGGTLVLLRDGTPVQTKANTGSQQFDTRQAGRYCVALTPPPGYAAVEQVGCMDESNYVTLHLRPEPVTPSPSATATATQTPGVTPSSTPTRTATTRPSATPTTAWVEPTLDPAIWPPCLVRVWNGQTVVYEGLGDHIEVVR